MSQELGHCDECSFGRRKEKRFFSKEVSSIVSMTRVIYYDVRHTYIHFPHNTINGAKQ